MAYEQKYNELMAKIDAVRKSPRLAKKEGDTFYNGYVETGIRHALDYLVQEDSDDERIRKFLIDILSHGTWRKEWPFGPNEVVAYLEKKKDNDYQTGRLEGIKEVCNNPEAYGLQMKEQKPESGSSEKPNDHAEWTDEEKDKLDRIYHLIGLAADTHAYSSTCRLIGDKECIELQDFLRSIAKPEVKPAEWSLTDATFIEEIDETLFMAETGRNEVVKNQIERERNWLKYLPKRVNLQPKQEWSEEDEKMLEAVIDNYKYMAGRLRKVDGCDDVEDDLIILDWLKSLRPQPHWKPSEEQMKALNAVANQGVLLDLFNDLLKLM